MTTYINMGCSNIWTVVDKMQLKPYRRWQYLMNKSRASTFSD